MTSTAARTNQLDPEALAALRAGVTGTVITPDDPNYDTARQIVSLAFDRRPAAIVRCEGTPDVAFSVRFAREHGIEFVPRSGGHAVMGHSVQDDAIVIDFSGMKGITIDPIRRVATVQPGVTSDDLAGPAGAYGLSLSTGDTGSVGIGGLTVGGGIGWMVRKYGLTIDNLLTATVVTADGDTVRASEDEHPDLFWALRGGGSNFGIVTECTFQLSPSGNILGGALVLPATREVLRGYVDYTPQAPNDLSTIAFMMAAPPAPFIPEQYIGQPVVLIGATWTGAKEDLDSALEPLRSLATPIADTLDAIPYAAMFAYTEEATKRHGAALHSMFADSLTDAQLDSMVAAMETSTSPFNQIQLRGLGGAMAQVPSDATAFAHRDANLMVSVIGIWMDPEDDGVAHRQWAEQAWSPLAPASRGVYVNFLQGDIDGRTPEAYRGVMQRLAEVKAKYDPENVFHFNANIRPR